MLLVPEKREFPKRYIEKTLEIFRERGLKSIIEIGSIREPLNHPVNELHWDCCGAGHSTIFWAKETEDFITADITPETIQNVRNQAIVHNVKIEAHCMDGIEFLRNHNKPIDLLFLDAWDIGYPLFAESHLLAFQAAEKNLHDKSMILIDDCDAVQIDSRLHFSEDGLGGKGQLIVPYAQERGWKVLMKGRQVLLSKEYANE